MLITSVYAMSTMNCRINIILDSYTLLFIYYYREILCGKVYLNCWSKAFRV